MPILVLNLCAQVRLEICTYEHPGAVGLKSSFEKIYLRRVWASDVGGAHLWCDGLYHLRLKMPESNLSEGMRLTERVANSV